MTAADSKSMEDRIAALEERTDEWQSALRVRIQGADKLSARGLELAQGSKEFWKLKSEVVDLLLDTLDPLLPTLLPDSAKRLSVRNELREVLSLPEYIYGVFPIGGKWGSEKSLDVRMKAGLAALRLSPHWGLDSGAANPLFSYGSL